MEPYTLRERYFCATVLGHSESQKIIIYFPFVEMCLFAKGVILLLKDFLIAKKLTELRNCSPPDLGAGSNVLL